MTRAAHVTKMLPAAERITLFIDPDLREGPANMAFDEALLSRPDPTLRLYGWKNRAISIGYFSSYRNAIPPDPAWELVRRWTGGGLVYHDGKEITWSVSAPPGHPWSQMKSPDLYERIHEALSDALRVLGVESRVHRQTQVAAGTCACFDNPVAGDLLTPAGAKLAGAAQRRGRNGFLQQGSIRLTPEPERIARLGEEFASRIAAQVDTTIPILEPEQLREIETKYRSPEWLARF